MGSSGQGAKVGDGLEMMQLNNGHENASMRGEIYNHWDEPMLTEIGRRVAMVR
jgi:hypothetical protein